MKFILHKEGTCCLENEEELFFIFIFISFFGLRSSKED